MPIVITDEDAVRRLSIPEAIEAMGVCTVLGDYLLEDNVARHATGRLAADLLELATQAPPKKRRHSSSV